MKFSLVIPVAPGRNAEIVESLKKQDYPEKDVEIIVMPGRNPSENRNNGAAKAKGDIIGFLDDDATIDSDFLSKVANFFKKHKKVGVDVVGGPQLNPSDEKGFAKVSGYALCSKFGVAIVTRRYSKKKIKFNASETDLTSANLFVRKEVMEKVKFDPSLFPGEDPKFVCDAKAAGFKVAYSPEFHIYHKRRDRKGDLVKQISNYGRVRPLKEKFVETLRMPLFLAPLLFIIYLIALLISEIVLLSIGISSEINLILAIPLIAYLLLDFFSSMIVSIKNKNVLAFLHLIWIYPLIHISYGLGMMKGYIQKWKRHRR